MGYRRVIRSLIAIAAVLRLAAAVDIDPKLYLEDVKYFASERLKGRRSGASQLDQAADFVARRFRELGLAPAGDGGYLQRFRVTTNSKAGKANRLACREDATGHVLELTRDYTPLSLSSSGKVSGPVVFVGYGITAHEYGYDDYAGIDVQGKVVLLMKHEPRESDDSSVFGGRVYTNHAQIESKAWNARMHGAAAVLLVADTPNHRGTYEEFERLGPGVGPDSPGIPFVQVKAEVVERWLRLAGRTLMGEVRAIDEDLKPRSAELPASLAVELSVDVRRESKPVSNVLGYLPGRTDEYLILGAHYDHVGLGEQYSMSPGRKGAVHPGADDNASGAAGVLGLARWFAAHPNHRRGILFVEFGGEEFGLLGSNHYVQHPTLPLSKAVAMLNLDMIGRIRDKNVYIGGVDTGTGFKALVEELNRTAEFNLEDSDSGNYGSSDHYSFTPKQIPFLFFFSGLHPDYHTPDDTWDRINAPDAARLLELVGAVIERLLDAPERPQFQLRTR